MARINWKDTPIRVEPPEIEELSELINTIRDTKRQMAEDDRNH